MSKNLRLFLMSFLLSLPFWWGVNLSEEKLEDFLFWGQMAKNPEVLLAQAVQEEQLAKLKPIRNPKAGDLQLGAKAATSVFIDRAGTERVLFEKNGGQILPIASLTKLMTAYVVLEHYDISETEIGRILYSLLIASDNKAADALAEILGQDAFVDLMNLEAKKLGLNNTYFVNPSGLDSDNESDPINYSTVQDLAKFAEHLAKERSLIWDISIIPEFEDAASTNELLNEIPGIIGGKTGWTPKAEGCLLLILRAPNGLGTVINVILGSQDRFGDMRKLIEWVNSAYKW